jgi:cell division protein FtsW (lipid II flippase)
MKHTLINTLSVLAIVAGLVIAAVAPWWAVWFICLPAIYAAVVILIKVNTNNIEYYG